VKVLVNNGVRIGTILRPNRAFSMHISYNPLERHISEVRDLPPHVLLFWTIEIHFGSSGFRSPLLTQLLLASSRSERSLDTCPWLENQWPQVIAVTQLAHSLIFLTISTMQKCLFVAGLISTVDLLI
jgi:hypothetical protein